MKMLLSIPILFLSIFAQAATFLEPALTFETGENTIAWPAPLTTSTGTSSGMGFNVKFGWQFEGTVYLGADIDLSRPTFKNSSVNYSAEAASNLYGVVLGIDLPLGFRVWGGYIIDGMLDPAASNGYDVSFKKAHGTKLGVGWKLILVSLNLEYMDLQYDDSMLESAAGIITNAAFSEKLSNKLTVFSVSLPMGF